VNFVLLFKMPVYSLFLCFWRNCPAYAVVQFEYAFLNAFTSRVSDYCDVALVEPQSVADIAWQGHNETSGE
jgi:hypothetical protein